MPIPELRC